MASSSDALSALADLLQSLFQIGARHIGANCPASGSWASLPPNGNRASVVRRSFDPALGVTWQAVDAAIGDGEKQLLELFGFSAPKNIAVRNAWRDENWMAAIEAEQRLRELAEYLSGARLDGGHGKRDDPATLLSPAKLAGRLSIPESDAKTREALRKRLESWRKANLDGGWIEARDPKPREPKYLYPLGKVWPLIQDLKPSG